MTITFCMGKMCVYTHQKKKLLAFSFANFKITRWSAGKQWGSLEYPANLAMCMQTQIPNSLWISSTTQYPQGVMNSGLQGKCTTN